MTSASGGNKTTVTINGTEYYVHEFTSDGSLDVTETGQVDVLLVGGGGAGGSGSAKGTGGGGGGGVAVATGWTLDNTGNYAVSVGSGASTAGGSGGKTVFNGITAIGGGGGNDRNSDGYDGGCGGGAGQGQSSNDSLGGSATQPGTNGSAVDDYGSMGGPTSRGAGDGDNAGGGGGATQAGANGGPNTGDCNGGDGYDASHLFGTGFGDNGWFGGGGAGGNNEGGGNGNDNYGGKGGGGDSPGGSSQSPQNGMNGAGGGGGGQAHNDSSGVGYGGDGTVLIRYEAVNAPSTPQNFSASPNGNDPDLSWDSVSWNGEQGHYNVYRGPVGGSLTEIAQVSAGTTSYNDTGASQDNNYDYAVEAENSAGTSNLSSRSSAVTLPNAPGSLSGEHTS